MLPRTLDTRLGNPQPQPISEAEAYFGRGFDEKHGRFLQSEEAATQRLMAFYEQARHEFEEWLTSGDTTESDREFFSELERQANQTLQRVSEGSVAWAADTLPAAFVQGAGEDFLFRPVHDQALRSLSSYSLGLIVNTNDGIRRSIQQAIASALTTGISREELSRRIIASGLQPGPWKSVEIRAGVIARTETMRAYNAGNLTNITETAAPFVEWIASPDEKTCPICGERDGVKFRAPGFDPLSAGVATEDELQAAEPPEVKAARLTEAAIAKFGTTDDIREAGYITPDGKMLDFSGRSEASGYHQEGDRWVPDEGQDDYLAGQRNTDHREVGEGGVEAMIEHIDSGFVRVMPQEDSLGLEIHLPLGSSQESTIRRQLRDFETLTVDVADAEGDVIYSASNYGVVGMTNARVLADAQNHAQMGSLAPEDASEAPRGAALTPEQYQALMPKRGGYQAKLRDQTLEALKTTEEGKLLADTLLKFQQTGSISRLRTAITNRISGAEQNETANARADGILGAIRGFPKELVPKELHRGSVVKQTMEELLARYTPGNMLDLNLTSFSSERRKARAFAGDVATGSRPPKRNEISVLTKLIGDKRALPIENTSKSYFFWGEREWVSVGRFEVVDVKKTWSDGRERLDVTVRQVDVP
jgi:hypothetical protein